MIHERRHAVFHTDFDTQLFILFYVISTVCLPSFASQVGEVGELCECFQWKHDTGVKEGLPGWTAEQKTHLGEELAGVCFFCLASAGPRCASCLALHTSLRSNTKSDVLIYLVRLADKCDIDLDRAVSRIC